MANTISSDIGVIINTEEIERTITSYVWDKSFIAGDFRFKTLVGGQAAVASFPAQTKSGSPIGAVANETTSLTTTAMAFTQVSVTVSRYGIARGISQTAEEDNILGESIYNQMYIEDGITLYGELMDTTAAALFSAPSSSVGSTGVALTMAVAASAIGLQRALKVHSKMRMVLHDKALTQLHTSQQAVVATPWAQFFTVNADSSNYGGTILKTDVLSSGLCPTANAAADVLGCVFGVGSHQGGDDRYSAFAFVLKRLPSSLRDQVILDDAKIWASYMRFGVGTIAGGFATKILSANS